MWAPVIGITLDREEPGGYSKFPWPHHEVDQCSRLLNAVAELDKRIDVLLHPTDALRSIPGIGLHLAPVLLGVLHTADRFRGERHLRGFCACSRREALPAASSAPSNN